MCTDLLGTLNSFSFDAKQYYIPLLAFDDDPVWLRSDDIIDGDGNTVKSR